MDSAFYKAVHDAFDSPAGAIVLDHLSHLVGCGQMWRPDLTLAEMQMTMGAQNVVNQIRAWLAVPPEQLEPATPEPTPDWLFSKGAHDGPEST
jgi:hypothetical protein